MGRAGRRRQGGTGAAATLGQAFTAMSALSPAGRAELRAALVATGHVVPDGPGIDQVGLDGISTFECRRALRSALQAALRHPWDAASVRSLRLGDLAPGASTLPDGPLPLADAGPRLAAILRREGCERWHALAAHTVGEVESWLDVGRTTLAELVAMCFERGLAALAAPAAVRPGSGRGGLAVLLDTERLSSHQPVLGALLDQRLSGEPLAVRAAAAAVLRSAAPWALDPEGSLSAVLDAVGAGRERDVFVAWSLQCGDRPTLIELAAELGVSSTRVGQLRDRAEAKARAALATSPPPLPWMAPATRAALGSLATEADAHDLMARHGLGGGDRPTRSLLLWLAGPYEPVPDRPGWLSTDPQGVLARTAAAIGADGGVRRLADVEAELADMGVTSARVLPWLAACGASVACDLVLSMSGSPADVAERVLDAHGREMAADEIVACMAEGGREVAVTTLGSTLRGRRFRWHDGVVGLADWGGNGKRSSPAALDGRSAASGPRSAPAAPISATTTGDADPDRLWLWVRVDADVLKGAEAGVPMALVEGVGLVPPRRRTFSGRFGPVTLAHDGPHPTRGSVRAVALAAGAALGDTVLLGFSPTGDLAVEVRRGSEQDGEPSATDLDHPSRLVVRGAP